ncbi:MAG: YeeE/YedE thiosulfate transporter family protein [Gammaproteobacteria bacterium]|nr:YeeE/YedE thiosulfate transporter family protein [Gammaproteobacteria bacterium]
MNLIKPRASLFPALIILLTLVAPPLALGEDESLIKDKSEALSWWIESAETGNANAQYTLAQMYASGVNGLGVSQDKRAAFSWFLKAAVQGHAKAQYEVGQSYEYGLGVKQDKDVAKTWYQQAAALGHSEAQEIISGTGQKTVVPVTGASPASPKKETSKSEPGSFDITSLLAAVTIGNSDRFWSWWAGGAMLAFLTISFWMAMGNTLGVSSSWDRLVRWRDDQQMAKAEARMAKNRAATQDAMLAAAIEEFGEEYVKQMMQTENKAASAKQAKRASFTKVPWTAHLTFLAMTLVGGLVAAVTAGDFQIQFSLGSEYERFFGFGTQSWILLITGGTLIGFGTRMGGGCSSGHGLSGCSRLQVGSLVGTGAFFGSAIAVSFILEALA